MLNYKHYDYYEVLKSVVEQDFDGLMLIFDLSTEKYIFVDETTVTSTPTTNTHGVIQNNDVIKIQYLSTRKAATHLLQQLVEKKFPGINYDRTLKKQLEEALPAGFMTYDSSRKERIYDVNGVKYFNSCYLPEHYWKEQTNEYTIDYFYETILPKFPEFQFLFNSLFSEKEEDIKYFLNWLVCSFMGRKNLTSVIITGQPGSGKGVLMKYISWYFGENNVLSASNELLTSQFNEQMENRLFVNLNEITLNKNRELYEKLKQWITDPTFNLNVKSIRQRVKANNMNFLITTNNQIPIEVSVDDRRYSIFKTKSWNLKHQVDDEYFKRFTDSFIDFTNTLKKTIVDFNIADSSIDNELKMNIAQASTTKSELLLKSLLSRDTETFEKYKEVFLEFQPMNNTSNTKNMPHIQKAINETNYSTMISDIKEGFIRNSIAQWSYWAFVDNKIQIATIGQKFNSYIGSPIKKTINKKRILVRKLPEGINTKKLEEQTKQELLEKISKLPTSELRQLLQSYSNSDINTPYHLIPSVEEDVITIPDFDTSPF